jgi:hypothetical protein
MKNICHLCNWQAYCILTKGGHHYCKSNDFFVTITVAKIIVSVPSHYRDTKHQLHCLHYRGIHKLLRTECKDLNILIEKVQTKTWLTEFRVAGPTWSVSAVNTGAVWLQRTRGWYQHAMLICILYSVQ